MARSARDPGSAYAMSCFHGKIRPRSRIRLTVSSFLQWLEPTTTPDPPTPCRASMGRSARDAGSAFLQWLEPTTTPDPLVPPPAWSSQCTAGKVEIPLSLLLSTRTLVGVTVNTMTFSFRSSTLDVSIACYYSLSVIVVTNCPPEPTRTSERARKAIIRDNDWCL
jgi:hypothetical protein